MKTLKHYNYDTILTQLSQIPYPQFQDGNTADSPVLARFGGTKHPHVIVSTQRTLRLEFTTDYSGVYPGFHIVWTAVPCKTFLYRCLIMNKQRARTLYIIQLFTY